MNATILRPWGWYSTVHTNKDITIKEIKLRPGATTELARSPRLKTSWLILTGTCTVIADDHEIELSTHDHYLLDTGTWYKLSNPGDSECKLIELTLVTEAA